MFASASLTTQKGIFKCEALLSVRPSEPGALHASGKEDFFIENSPACRMNSAVAAAQLNVL